MSSLPFISPEILASYQKQVVSSGAPATHKRKISSLKKFFDWAHKEGRVPQNPFVQQVSATKSVKIKGLSKRIKVGLIVGGTLGMAVLTILLVQKLGVSIPFRLAPAQEGIPNSRIQVGTPAPTAQTTEAIPSTTTASISPWTLYTKLNFKDETGDPIQTVQSITFSIYPTIDSTSALWTSPAQEVTPDAAGNVRVVLRDVPTNLFFENETLYLAANLPSGGTGQRTQVSTASSGGQSQTAFIGGDGNLLLAGESPSVIAEDGNLLIEGQTVTITTATASDGDIEVNPDGNGIVHFLFEGTGQNYLNAQAPNLTKGSLYYGIVANNSTGYDLLRLQNGSKATTRFAVDARGNTTTTGTLALGGGISTLGTERLTSAGALTNIAGYSQSSGNFSIVQSAGDTATITKNGSALSDLLTLTLDERPKPGNPDTGYSTLTLKRYDGAIEAYALFVDEGNARFDGQLQLGRFGTNPSSSIGEGSLIYNSTDDTVYVWDGASWNTISGGSSAIVVQESDTTVAATASTFDLLGGDFDVSESPANEANIQLASTLTSVTGVAGDFNVGGNDLTSSGDLIIDPTGGGVSIGTGTPGTVDLAGDDLYVTGDLEVDGVVYGNGSGLTSVNADTLDTLDSTQFLRSDTSDNFTSGTLTTDAGTTLDVNGDLAIADTNIVFDGATTTFTTTGDLIIDSGGGQIIFSDTDTINIGGLTGVTYNAFANAGEAPDEAAISSDNDVYIGGDLEVDGTIYGNIAGSAGSVSWNDITNPDGDLSLSMAAYNTTFSWDPGADNAETALSLAIDGQDSTGGGDEDQVLISLSQSNNGVDVDEAADTLLSLANNDPNDPVNSAIRFDAGAAGTDFTYGINFDAVSIGTAELLLQNAETIDNTVDGTIALTADNTALSGDLAINGGNITTAVTADSTLTVTGTLTANGTLDANGDVTIADTNIVFDGATTTFTTTGDLTIDSGGGQVLFADTDTLNIGGLTGVSYNALANAGEAPEEAAISSDNDLYIGGDLEVDGTIYGAVVGSIPWSEIDNPVADLTLTMAAFNTTFNWDPGADSAETSFTLTIQGEDSTGGGDEDQVLLALSQTSNGVDVDEAADALLTFANADANDPVNSAIRFDAGAAGTDFTYGINFDAATVGTAEILLQNAETIDNTVDGTITLTAPTTSLSGDLAINGGNITTAVTADSTLTVTGTLTANGTLDANGLFTLGDDGETGAIDTSDWNITTTGDLSGIGSIGADGDLTITQTTPSIFLVDSTGSADDYSINVDANAFTVVNDTDGRTELTFAGDGGITLGSATATSINLTTDSTGNAEVVLPDDSIGPNEVFTTGQTDEYCLTYESTGTTWEWQACGSGGAPAWNEITDPTGDLTLSMAAYNTTFNWDPGADSAETSFSLTTQGEDTTAGGDEDQVLLALSQTSNGADVDQAADALLTFANADANDPVVNAIRFDAGGAGTDFTYGINFDAASIGTAELIFQNAETIDNTVDGTLAITAPTTSLSGDLIVTGGDINGPSGENIDLGEATADTITFYIGGSGELILNGTALAPSTDSGLDLGSSSSQFADLYLDGGNINLDNATDIDVDDNTASALTISQGSNNYVALTTTDSSETLSFGNTTTNPAYSFLGSGTVTVGGDLAVNGATSADITSTTTTASLFNSNVTTLNIGGAVTTLNLGDAATTKTIDIGGVTASGTDTINIATNATAADTINIGNTAASTATTISGGVINLTTDSTGNAEVVLPNDSIGPNEVFTTGQTDEYCLTYESTGTTWEWQACGGSSLAWSSLTDPADDLTLSMAAYNTTFNWDPGADSAETSFSLTTQGEDTTAGGDEDQVLLALSQTSNGADVDQAADALLTFANADANDPVVNAIRFDAGGAGTDFTYGINFDAATIGTAELILSNSATIANTSDGTLALTEPTIQLIGSTAIDIDSPSINLATQATDIELIDNTASALTISEGANNYLAITTTNSSETLQLGNATTNPSYSFLGTGAVTIAGSADGTDALILTLGDILVTDGDFDISGGDFNVTLDAGDGVNIAKGAAPTVDVFSINGGTSATDGVDALQLTFTADDASGNLIDLSPTFTDNDAGNDAETWNVIDIDALTVTQNDSGGAVTGIVRGLNIGNLTESATGDDAITSRAINIGTGWDYGLYTQSPTFLDADTTDATGDVLSLDIGTLTNGVDGIFLDLNVTGDTGNDADVFSGINILASNNATDQTTDDNIYGLYIQNLGGTALAGNEYAIYQAGTGWDYGLYLEDAAYLGGGVTSAGNLTINKADPSIIFDTVTATDTDFWVGVQEDAGGDDDDKFQIGDGTTPGSNIFFTIDTAGNVGIGQTSPTTAFHLGSGAETHALSTGDALISSDLELDGVLYLDGGIIANVSGTSTITFSGTPTTSPNSLTNGSWLVTNSVNTEDAALSVVQNDAGDIFSALDGATTRFLVANDGITTITTTADSATASLIVSCTGSGCSGSGTGKINVGTVDPVYTIGDGKYATYMAGMVGVKEEVTGSVQTNEYIPGIGYRHVVDFKSLSEGSDLWLFSKASDLKNNIDKMVVLLSPEGNNRAWYRVDDDNYTLSVYSTKPTNVSFRLTAPRFDYALWSNYNHDEGVTGFILEDEELNGNGEIDDPEEDSIANYQIEKVQTQNGFIYRLRDLAGNVVSEFAKVSDFLAANIKAGIIETDKLATSSLSAGTAVIDDLLITSGLVSPIIQTSLISPLPDSGDITIQIGSGTDEEGKLAIENGLGEEVASIDTEGNATFEGTLEADSVKTNDITAGKIYADEIVARNGYFGQTQTESVSGITREEIEQILSEVEESQDLLAQAATWSVNTEAEGGIIDEVAVANLFVTEQAAVNLLSVAETITTGSDLVISSINSVNSINSLTAPLQLQSLALAPVEIMAGKVRIETNGDVHIDANLYVAGNIESQGLTSQIADLNKLTTEQVIIAGAETATPSAVVNGEIQTNATVGATTIAAGVTEITVRNPKITDYTLVYITPTSPTENKTLYVKSKGAGFFTIGFSDPIGVDANFNWWIIESAQ